MPRWQRLVRVAGFAALLLSASGAAGQAPVFPSHDVRIDVSVLDTTTANVVETYVPDGDVRDATFEFLDTPCSTVGTVGAKAGDRPVTFDLSRRGPWTVLHAADTPREHNAIQVSYRVQIEGTDAAVPIVLPAATLEPAGPLRGAAITLRVTFASAIETGSVLLPRLERAGTAGAWEARLLAIPSVVRLRVPGGEPATCDRALPGSTGGLEWRFWIFVATMATWIPIYFWRFSRRDNSG